MALLLNKLLPYPPEAWVFISLSEHAPPPHHSFQGFSKCFSPGTGECLVQKTKMFIKLVFFNRYKSSAQDTSHKYKTSLSLGTNCNSPQLNFFWNNWHCLKSEIGHWTRRDTNVIWYRLLGPGQLLLLSHMDWLESWLTSCLTRVLLFEWLSQA